VGAFAHPLYFLTTAASQSLTTNYFDELPATELAPRLPSGATVKVVWEDSLADRIGARMRSRPYEMCRTVEVFAPNFRREPANPPRTRVGYSTDVIYFWKYGIAAIGP